MSESNGGPLTVALIALEAKRVDDLRAADNLRQDDLRDQAKASRDALNKMAEEHRKELAAAENKSRQSREVAEQRRIDALLGASDSRANLTATRAEGTASALAERVDNSAKTLAAQVEATAKANLAAVEASNKSLIDRIAPLERARYEQSGKSEVSDPALISLMEDVKKLASAASEGGGKSKGIGMMGAVILGAVAVISALLSIFAFMKPAPVQPVAVPIVAPR